MLSFIIPINARPPTQLLCKPLCLSERHSYAIFAKAHQKGVEVVYLGNTLSIVNSKYRFRLILLLTGEYWPCTIASVETAPASFAIRDNNVTLNNPVTAHTEQHDVNIRRARKGKRRLLPPTPMGAALREALGQRDDDEELPALATRPRRTTRFGGL